LGESGDSDYSRGSGSLTDSVSSSVSGNTPDNEPSTGESVLKTTSASPIRPTTPSGPHQTGDVSQALQSPQQEPQPSAEEELVVQPQGDEVYVKPERGSFLDYDAVRESVDRKCQKMRANGFTEDETSFYMRLELRGVQSMLPSHWHTHFPSFPHHIFTANKEEQYFNAQTSSEFR
ncbi:MAG: hypothetical protein M4579_007625, partial [Chaenotheca gracillima]